MPNVCPDIDCSDVVTTHPSTILVDMFEHLARLKYDQATEVKIFAQELTICGQVRKESTRSKYAGMAKRKGWLVDIDFAKLPERVMSMKDELDKLLTVAEEKKHHYCWDFLVDELRNCSFSITELAKTPIAKTPLHIFEMVRPG
jgi:hypothetical protein